MAWSSLSPNILLATCALCLQAVVSWSQLVSSDRPFGVQYLVSLAISVSTSVAGYLPLLSLWLLHMFKVEAWSIPWWLAAGVFTLVAVAADVVPERILFEG